MVTTRSMAEAEASPSKRTTDSLLANRSDLQEESPYFTLPKELRLHILRQVFAKARGLLVFTADYQAISFVIEDEPPSVACNVIDKSTQLIWEDPAVAHVCRLLRKEAIPLVYSRKAFLLNIRLDWDLSIDHLRVQAQRHSDKIQYMRKVTLFSQIAEGGQASITFDFKRLEIVDARWKRFEHELRPRSMMKGDADVPHCHISSDGLKIFQEALDQGKALESSSSQVASIEEQSLSAFLSVLGVCYKFFYIHRKGGRTRAISNRGPPGNEWAAPCKCTILVKPMEPKDQKPARLGPRKFPRIVFQ